MSKINQNLYGLWQMVSMRFKDEGGEWRSEPVDGGTSLFTSTGRILTFTRGEIAFGYSGSYVIEGDNLIITPEICIFPELESTKFVRTVQELSADALQLAMTDAATGRHYEIKFRLSTRTI